MLRLRHRAEDIARQRTCEAAGHPCRLGTTKERRQERELYQRFLIEELARRQPQINQAPAEEETAMTTMTPDQRAYTLRCARMLAETGEDADSVDTLIAKAVGYRPMDGRERLNLTVRGRRIAPEDEDILIRRTARVGPCDDARLYRILRTYVLSLNN